MGFGTFEEIEEASKTADQFEGEIAIDEEVENTFQPDKTRWHYGVRPDGTDKVIQAWYNAGTRGQMAQVVASLRKAMPKDALAGKKPGEGDLIGIRGTFERKTFTYTDRETGERKESNNPTIVMVKYTGTTSKAAFDDDDVVNMLTVLDGKKSSEYQRGIMKDPLLSNAAKVGILSGDAQTWLVEQGYAVLEGDVLHSTEKALDLAQR